MIKIKKSKTADTRTCDFTKVTKQILLESSWQHIDDVNKGLLHFMLLMKAASGLHDHTKIENIDEFHEDFKTGFKVQNWYDMHKRVERHHISVPEGVREDVNLIDVLEYITDCVMAGMGRTGEVTPLELSSDTLQKAFQNTVALLASNIEVKE